MKTAYTSGQLGKFTNLLDQKGVDSDKFQSGLTTGFASDFAEALATLDLNVLDRDTFRKALGLGTLTSGLLVVDYSKSLEVMIAAGRYDWKSSDITDKRFPIKGKGKVELETKLFHFNRDISSEKAVELIEADDNAWESAKIEDLLAYGAKNPEEQRKYPIIGLGSVCRVGGRRIVPRLDRDDSERGLNLRYWDVDWSGYVRFLAVRKV